MYYAVIGILLAATVAALIYVKKKPPGDKSGPPQRGVIK